MNSDIANFNDWPESRTVQCISQFDMRDIDMYGGRSFCRKILNGLRRINLFVDNSGHGCPPPDYYSDQFGIMFDVMRVNDSERKKNFNPVFQEQDEAKKKVREIVNDFDFSNLNAFACRLQLDQDICYDEIHRFLFYKKQVIRVLTKHIKEIPLWKKEHPDISHKGFVILDEAGLCFPGMAVPLNISGKTVIDWMFCVIGRNSAHIPWLDLDFMNLLLESDLDFVVWYRPYAIVDDDIKDFCDHYCNLAVIDVRSVSAHQVRSALKTYDANDPWFFR